MASIGFDAGRLFLYSLASGALRGLRSRGDTIGEKVLPWSDRDFGQLDSSTWHFQYTPSR